MRHSQDLAALTDLKAVQGHMLDGGDIQVGIRDRITVGVKFWVPQDGIHALF